jgi:hypothetical protein
MLKRLGKRRLLHIGAVVTARAGTVAYSIVVAGVRET